MTDPALLLRCGTRAPGLLFSLGAVCITDGASRALGPLDPLGLLQRHAAGDWAGMTPDDRDANVAALRDGARIFSSFDLGGCRVWVITEADRSSTTILLPGEY